MEVEARARLKRAEKSLKAARVLYESELYEDAVNRAYYAMHHAAKAALALEDSSPKTHQGLINQFGERIVKLGKIDEKRGKELAIGLEMRIKSDYAYNFEVDKKKVKEALRDAEEFVAAISKYVLENKDKQPR